MNPTTEQTSMRVYASDNDQYRTEPNENQTKAGVVPLDTLPAAWWNWLWNKVTSNNNASLLSITDLRTEIGNVLTNAGITANAQVTNQLAQAIIVIHQRKPFFDDQSQPVPGSVISSSSRNSVSVDAQTGKMTANALSDWVSQDSVKTVVENLGQEEDTKIGTLSNLTTTVKTDLVAAINEVDGHADDNATAIGDLSLLSTTVKTDLVSAINEVDVHADDNATAIGDLSLLSTTVKTDLVSAINEVDGHADDNATAISDEVTARATHDVASVDATFSNDVLTITVTTSDGTTYTDDVSISVSALADKQNKTLETPITVDGTQETTVEGALGAINTLAAGNKTDKQNKTLDTPITVDGTQETTVEGALGAINTLAADNKTNKQDKTLSTPITANITTVEQAVARNGTSIVIGSTNGGETWKSSESVPAGLAPVIVQNSNNQPRAITGCTIIRYSDDGGATWTSTSLSGSKFLLSAPFTYNNKQRIVAVRASGTQAAGINYSDDGGATWTASTTNTGDYYYTPVVIVPHNNSVRLVAGRAAGRGILYSDDGGATWKASNITSGSHYISQPFSYNNDMRVIATYNTGSGGGGIRYSDDGGATWTTVDITGDYYIPTAFEYNGHIRLVIGSVRNATSTGHGILYSDDGGATWASSNITSGAYANPTAFAYNGHIRLAVGSQGQYSSYMATQNPGILYSDDGGATWTSSNITSNQYSPTAFEYNGRIRLVAGSGSTTAGGGIVYSDDGGATWSTTNITSGGYDSPTAFIYKGLLRLVTSPTRSTAVALYTESQALLVKPAGTDDDKLMSVGQVTSLIQSLLNIVQA